MPSTTTIHERRAGIIRLAVQQLGERQAMVWFQTAKVALDRRTPLEAMATEEGCRKVESLLAELWN